jgi:putative transposase
LKTPRYLSREEKEGLVRRLEAGERLAALAAETGVLRKSLYEWRAAYRAMGAAGLNRKRGPKPGGRAAAARRACASQGAGRRAGTAGRTPAGGPRFFSRSLAVMGRKAPRERRAHLFATIEKVTGEGLQGETKASAADVAHLCAIAGLSRASYYRWREPQLSARDDASLRDLIQRLALKRRCEGYRRIARRLTDEGLLVNAKRVLRLMRADNLLSLRRRPFVAPTTDSRHRFPVCPNLARSLEPTGLDQLWVADITYVRLAEAFVYLAVVLDAFSRKVVGWALDDHLEARLALAALDLAIEARDPPPGLVHHSDRGVQYASAEYAARLDQRGFQRSMSRPGNPWDNAKAESFMKTLKAEEVDGRGYASLDDARRNVGAFIDDVYNADRLHSALGYQSPIAFEAAFRKTTNRDLKSMTALSPN